MASEKPSITMLEAFLRQVEPPVGNLTSERLDWPLGLLAFMAFFALPFREFSFYGGILICWLVIHLLRTHRKKQLERQPAAFRMEYERWKRVRRIAKLAKTNELAKKAPRPVLLALEHAARTWHDAREALQGIAITDPTFAAEAQVILDASMSGAAAAADPVVLRDEWSKKELPKMEADSDLMARVCTRINQEEVRMRHMVPDPGSLAIDTPNSLRERLARAQSERAAAEAELDALI